MAAAMAVAVLAGACTDFSGLYKSEGMAVMSEDAREEDIPAALNELSESMEFSELGRMAVAAVSISNSDIAAADGYDIDETILNGELSVLGSAVGSNITGITDTAYDVDGDIASFTEDIEKTIFDYNDLPEYFKNGVRHEAVKLLQERLMKLGFMEYSEPTEYYGTITEAAVMLFQRQNGLTQDGIIGPDTLRAIFADTASSYYMAKGMKGDDISQLQTRLYEIGYFASADMITGYFGDTTEAAVKSFQQNNGVTADGIVNNEGIELLYSEDVKANILSFGDKSDVVLECQKILKKLGYMYTEPDGMYGSDTLSAVKRFQENNGLTADGYLGPSTLAVLHSNTALANGLKLGVSGDNVLRLQELLKKYGYLEQANLTGYFGTVTEDAVKQFQRNNGLTCDGIAGSNTINLLTKGAGVVKASDVKNTSSSSGSTSSGSTSSSTASSSSGSSTGTGVSASKLVEIAKSKVGCRYSLGAKGPDSFDCSGFVYWCLNQAGVKQSYLTSYGWRSVGKYVKITNISDVKAGDIVVVYGHVGIAAGNGMVVDASSSSGKIVYRELNNWWKRNFICAWRIF